MTPRPLLRRALPPLLFVALVFLVYADPVFTRRLFSGRDLVPYGLPMEKATHDAYGRGRLPVWNEDVSGGRPILPNPNAGALYPVRPLLSRLPFPTAMRLFPVLHWASAGVGMWMLLSALRVSRSAAWIGAATFVFSGVSVSQVFYQPFGPAVALHPWLLWALVRRRDPRRKALTLGLVWGLLFLLGDVFAIAIALLAALLWMALEVERVDRRRELAAFGAGLVLGGLLAAPQIVATVLLVPQTQRVVGGMRLREVLGFTLSPWRVLELVVPYPFGDTWTLEDHRVWGRGVFRTLYATVYAGAFAVVSLSVVRRSRRTGSRFAFALFASGLALAAVGSLAPRSWGLARSWIPLRYPEKFVVAMTLGLALAAGLALDHFRGLRPPRWLLAVAVVLAALAAAAKLFPAPSARLAIRAVGAGPGVSSEAAEELPGALAEAGLLWLATLLALDLFAAAGRAREIASLVVLTAVPILANRRIAPTEHEGSVLPPTAFARTLLRRDPSGVYRTIDEASYRAATPMQLESERASPFGTESARRRWKDHTQVLWGRGTVFNEDSDRADFSRVESLRSLSVLAAAEPGAAAFFSSVALRFGIRFRDQAPLPGYRRFGGGVFEDWDENPAATPDVRLLRRWAEARGAVEALHELPRLGPEEVVLETGRAASGVARPGAIRFMERTAELMRLRSSVPDPTWLFVLRGFWNHRRVRIDGRDVECVPAQLAFSAIPVPAGEHTIEWREEVPGLAASRWGPVIFAGAAALLLLRRKPAGSSPA